MARQPFIWAALRALDKLLNALPHPMAVRIGASIGSAVGRFSSKRMKKTTARVERVLGVTHDEARRIAGAAYRNFGRDAVEMLRMPRMADKMSELVELNGEEHMQAALARGRGAILLSAHIGNWEYGAVLLAKKGYTVSAIMASQRDERITELAASLRNASGVKSVFKGFALREAVACLHRGEILAVLLDQDAREAGVVSDFLGLPASTPIGPLKIAQKSGVPIVPARCVRRADGITFKMTCEPPIIDITDIKETADLCNSYISEWIRRDPEQWMWMYPRWQTTLGDR